MADTTGLLGDEIIDPVSGQIVDQKELAQRLLAQAREQGVSLTGPGGLLSQLTKKRARDRAGRGTDRAPGPRARRDPVGREHAQWDPGEDRVDPDRSGRDRGPAGP